jgi:hypothetical protein
VAKLVQRRLVIRAGLVNRLFIKRLIDSVSRN